MVCRVSYLDASILYVRSLRNIKKKTERDPFNTECVIVRSRMFPRSKCPIFSCVIVILLSTVVTGNTRQTFYEFSLTVDE